MSKNRRFKSTSHEFERFFKESSVWEDLHNYIQDSLNDALESLASGETIDPHELGLTRGFIMQCKTFLNLPSDISEILAIEASLEESDNPEELEDGIA